MNQPSLFDQRRARANDPATSYAAALVGDNNCATDIMAAFHSCAPMTDDELCAVLPGYHPPTVKSCRTRLYKQGLLEPTGVMRPSNTGRLMTVWCATFRRTTDVVETL